MQELNTSVPVVASAGELTEDFLAQFQVTQLEGRGYVMQVPSQGAVLCGASSSSARKLFWATFWSTGRACIRTISDM